MQVVRVIHWNAQEASALLSILRKHGLTVEYDERFSTRLLQHCRSSPPSAFVIDLSRSPSHGREVAAVLRQSPKTRHVPIVFCDGQPDKTDRIRKIFPDATFCARDQVLAAVKSAKPVENPIRPIAMMERFGNRTAAQKLGITKGSTIALIDPPRDALTALGEIPADVRFCDEEEDRDVTLCFVHDIDSAREKLSGVRRLASKSRLWILWRKKGAAGASGVSGNLIREIGIDLGLVDYKICAVNDVWSAMVFAKRKS
jgi:CheY-like chemotaxis protein